MNAAQEQEVKFWVWYLKNTSPPWGWSEFKFIQPDVAIEQITPSEWVTFDILYNQQREMCSFGTQFIWLILDFNIRMRGITS